MSDMEIIYAENNHTIVKMGGRKYELFRTIGGVRIFNDVGEQITVDWTI